MSKMRSSFRLVSSNYQVFVDIYMSSIKYWTIKGFFYCVS